MYEGGWLVLARFVQFSFLGLTGVSLAISYNRHGQSFYKKQLLRGLHVFGMGMLITLVTYVFVREDYVKFGILHLIGLSIVFLHPFASKKYFNLILSLVIFVIAVLIDKTQVNSMIGFILGFKTTDISSLDYFPIFPWIGIVSLGAFLGNIIYKNNNSLLKLNSGTFKPIIFLGRHSLIIYMTHIPIIVLAVYVIMY